MSMTVTAFYATRSDAAPAWSELESVGIRTLEVSVIDNEPRRAQDLGVRFPSQRLERTGDPIGERLAAPGTLVIPGLNFSIAGPIVEALADAGDGEGDGVLVGALVRCGVGEYEARYLADAVARGGTVLVARVSPEQAERLEGVFERTGGRRLHESRERPPVLRA